MNVITSFFYGKIEYDVHMEFLARVTKIDWKSTIWTLVKALYGLKMAFKAWNTKIYSILKYFGFTNSSEDPRFYVMWKDDEDVMVIAPYVYDLHFVGNKKCY